MGQQIEHGACRTSLTRLGQGTDFRLEKRVVDGITAAPDRHWAMRTKLMVEKNQGTPLQWPATKTLTSGVLLLLI